MRNRRPTDGQVGTWRWPGRPTAARREEEEARTFLVGVTEETAMRLGLRFWSGSSSIPRR